MSNGPTEKEVTITLNGNIPVPSVDPVQIKKDNQKVRWCSEYPFEIRFDNGATYQSSSGGTGCANRAVSDTFSEIKRYKYTIIVNGIANDPEVDVKP